MRSGMAARMAIKKLESGPASETHIKPSGRAPFQGIRVDRHRFGPAKPGEQQEQRADRVEVG